MYKSSIKDVLRAPADGRTEIISGWVRTRRDSKNIIFVEVNDGSSFQSIQVVIDRDSASIDQATLQKVLTGSSIRVSGNVIQSQGKNQGVEIAAGSIELIGESPPDYPLQKKRHSFEFLREIAHLRPRTNTFGAVTRVRNTLSRGIHDFFQERGFLWIPTPIITGSDAEGAGNMFQVTTLNMAQAPQDKQGRIDYSQDFFGKKAHLTVSGQLQAENYACSMSKVYTFGPTFRAENSNTSRHLSEFWMIEPEMAFADLNDNRQMAEELIQYLLNMVLETCEDDMAFFDKWVEKGTISKLRQVSMTPFVHLCYNDAIKELESAKADFEFTPRWGMDLQAEHERFLTEQLIGGPVTVTDYPKEIKAFYMKQNDDGKTVRAMDVLVPRLGEIIGGSQREDDVEKLQARMQEMGMDCDEYSWYLDLRRYGSVPHCGFGLGFERLVQYVTGMQNIRDVIPFPRAPKTIAF